MKRKNKQTDKSLPEVNIIAEIDDDVTTVDELDKITFNIIEEHIVDNDKPREFLIFCEATCKKDVTSLHTALETTLGFTVCKPIKQNNTWIVDGQKQISYDQLASTLKNVRSTVELYSCKLVDWRIQVDNNSV